MDKQSLTKEDGRYIIFYTFEDEETDADAVHEGHSPPGPSRRLSNEEEKTGE